MFALTSVSFCTLCARTAAGVGWVGPGCGCGRRRVACACVACFSRRPRVPSFAPLVRCRPVAAVAAPALAASCAFWSFLLCPCCVLLASRLCVSPAGGRRLRPPGLCRGLPLPWSGLWLACWLLGSSCAPRPPWPVSRARLCRLSACGACAVSGLCLALAVLSVSPALRGRLRVSRCFSSRVARFCVACFAVRLVFLGVSRFFSSLCRLC
jgi:hypothetical protein